MADGPIPGWSWAGGRRARLSLGLVLLPEARSIAAPPRASRFAIALGLAPPGRRSAPTGDC
jgi:hypothetical protein